ncbi:MAG TPA: hypothetical protein DD434_08075, partial [Bacteroidales bacterium]|nr:hypothetical protein [Bacteroidales bacterium]
ILREDWITRYNDLKETHLRQLISLGHDLSSFSIDNISFEEYEKRWFNSLETLKHFSFINSEYFLND